MANVLPTGEIEREIQDAYVRLAESAAVVRYCHDHYLDGLIAAHEEGARRAEREFAQLRADAQEPYEAETEAANAPLGGATGDLFSTVTALRVANPWAMGGFGDQAWDDYHPDLEAPLPDGLRVGVLKLGDVSGLPRMPAVAGLAGHGHLLIRENECIDGARSLLQALTLRLATATRPGSVRLALADPVGQGQHLSAFLRLPALLRMGSGVAASPAEIEALLTALADHVVEVTQTRLTNVYDSIEAYNAATTGVAVPYHFLILAGFPAGVTDRAAEFLTRLARNGPRAGVYILATLDPGQKMPRDFDLSGLTALATNLRLDDQGSLTWDDPDFGQSVIEPDRMPAASRANLDSREAGLSLP